MNKDLKTLYDVLQQQYNAVVKQNKDLQKELQEIKKENEELKNRLKTLDDEEFVYEVTEIEYNNFKKMNKYKQALEEIREMTEKIYNKERKLLATGLCVRPDLIIIDIRHKIDEVLK